MCASPVSISMGKHLRRKVQVAEEQARKHRQLGDAVHRMVRLQGLSVRSVGRELRLTDVEVFYLYLDADARHEEQLAAKMYRAGRLSNMPQPPVQMRRAA